MKTPDNAYRRSVPAISPGKQTDKEAHHPVFHWLMMVCCLAMVAGVGLIILAAPTDQPFTQVLLTASPLLACLGLHLVIHKLIGLSCHSDNPKKDSNS